MAERTPIPLPFAWFMVIAGAALFALGVVNLILNTDRWFASAPLLVLMPFSVLVAVRAIRQHRAGSTGGPVEFARWRMFMLAGSCCMLLGVGVLTLFWGSIWPAVSLWVMVLAYVLGLGLFVRAWQLQRDDRS